MKSLTPNKKFGGRHPNRLKIETFNRFLFKANLLDLGFVGLRFTWTNGRSLDAIIRTRIDRAHANPNWLNLFLETKVFHLPCLFSDHCPILLRTNPHYDRGKKPFRFEPFWMKHHSFTNLILL